MNTPDFLMPLSLFLIGIWGIFVVRKNIILILISLELLFLSGTLNFIFFSIYLDDLIGQIFALCIISVTGAESALALSILVSFFRLRGDISIDVISNLKG